VTIESRHSSQLLLAFQVNLSFIYKGCRAPARPIRSNSQGEEYGRYPSVTRQSRFYSQPESTYFWLLNC
jgi:hypothetical protein